MLILTLFFGLTNNSISQSIIDSTRLKLWEDFKLKYGENLNVKWNYYTQTPSLIYGQLIDLNYSDINNGESIEKIALDFISENKDLFLVETEKLICWKNTKVGKHWFISFYQTYDGLHVQHSKIGIAFTDDFKIKAIGDHYHPNISVSTTPHITSTEAVNWAAQSVNVTSNQANDICLVIYPIENENALDYYLAWKFELTSNNP